jgi:hypothetical protein
MHCTGSHSSWKKRKVKSEKDESQLVRQAKHTMQKEAMHHTQIEEGSPCKKQIEEDTIGTDLGWTTLSMPIDEGLTRQMS